MEHVVIKLDDGTGHEFDEALKGTLPDAGDLKVITKNDATVGGKPAVMLTFTVQLPDGTMQRVQTVTTAKMFVSAAAAVKGRYNLN